MIKKRNIKRRKRFVAFLDVMGTKKLIEHGQDKRIFQLLESIRDVEKGVLTDDYVKMYFFSDSIILYTIDDCAESFRSILYTCAQIVEHFLTRGFGINGCISYGACTCDNKDGKYITVGKPFVDAYIIQNKLWCYGVVIDQKAIKKVNDSGYSVGFESIVVDPYFEWKLPSKENGWETLNMVNWMEFVEVGNPDMAKQKNDVKTIIKNLYETYRDVGRGTYYIQNTEIVMKQWYDYLAERNYFHNYQWGDMLSDDYLTKCP